MKKMEGLDVGWGEAPRMVVLWGQLREDSDHKCVTNRSDLCHAQEFTASSAMQPKHCLLIRNSLQYQSLGNQNRWSPNHVALEQKQSLEVTWIGKLSHRKGW